MYSYIHNGVQMPFVEGDLSKSVELVLKPPFIVILALKCLTYKNRSMPTSIETYGQSLWCGAVVIAAPAAV